jgi:hypothetical protein
MGEGHMTYQAENYNIQLRTNDDFTMNVSVDYDITALALKFKIKRSELDIIDWSAYIVKTGAMTFTISVKADIINAIGILIAPYDCIVDFGTGSKDFLFGGNISIAKGVSV